MSNVVEYIPYKWDLSGYSADNGQAMIITECCNRCYKWEGQNKIAPRLVKNKKGFIYCPQCQPLNKD